MRVGDFVTLYSGEKIAIASISFELKNTKVYNFEVDNFHTYFVSPLRVLAHNCPHDPSKPKHKNSNDAEGEFIIYKVVDKKTGEILKYGKAKAEDVMKDGSNRRAHTSGRKVQKKHGREVEVFEVEHLGKTTTGKAKEVEKAYVKFTRQTDTKGEKALPYNREKNSGKKKN